VFILLDAGNIQIVVTMNREFTKWIFPEIVLF